ncbi:alpha-glucoside ABC transporter substrate-binding protein [Vibrio sp. 10N.286.49.C2]|uniref:ABC transporter substrate-binding protein n=1 Tax=unclassified Vibrio TaxID=2614977 RepID=UPI000C853641|nr:MULTISPECIES: ABC transporter substrate-binding protein [unclassified Vibrio]PMH42804.1 alpha-glucoside ABC transporter substrate-binding protein [Vibrio sp. 10N.286.49.C2]PMH53858.1 alpha-glucoside ABC transporter substrate-binding protein [Vibrio sp. 10N.286.49.B1]
MKTSLLAGAIAVAISASSAFAADLKFTPGDDDRFSWQNYEELKAMDLKGETVTIFGPWLTEDKELVESVIAYFEEATGAEVKYSGSDSFEQQIAIDVQAGSAPNIVIFPQPGLAADLASKGFLSPLDPKTGDWVKENYAAGSSWVDLGTFADEKGNDQLFGFFYKVDLKSLVWYVPENFEDAGYEVPESMEELKALTEQIVKDGETPWCVGVGSGGATGWPATDWVEDMMLRTQSPTDYDKWTTNELKFNDKKVVEAIEEYGWFTLNDAFVDGGARAVAATDFRDSPKGLFTSPAKCYMHRQASFIPSFFPEGTELGEDADFFYFPSYESKDLGKPVLGAGTLWSITKDSKASRAFMEYLQSPLAHEVWMAQSGFLTPHKGANVETYGNDTLKKQGQILLDATTFRFDGSDLMPGKVGAGAFWTGMVDYSGGKPAQEVADDIQKTWDALK